MMTTDNVNPEALDAPKPVEPAAPAAPATPSHLTGYLSGLDITDEMIDNAGWREKDKLIVARAAAREARRTEDEKKAKESAESSARAKKVVDDLVAKDKATPEDQKPAPGGPPVALAVPPMLTASQQPLAEGYTASMGEIAAEMGMAAEEAQTLLDFVIGGATQTLDGLDTSNKEEVLTHLHSIYGEQADGIIAGAQAGFKKLPEGVQIWLDRTTEDGQCLANHPSVLVMLSLWNGGYSKLTPERAAKELAQHRATKEYLAGDRFKLEKVRLLTMIATRGQESRELLMPAKTAPAAKSAVEQEIASIRKNPDYVGLDSKKRAPLVARMSALMAQLHQG
jgi:hypothetical protein